MHKRICEVLVALFMGTAAMAASLPNVTPLEQAGFSGLPDTATINRFLESLAANSPFVKTLHPGQSAGGRDFTVVLVSKDPGFLRAGNHTDKLTVLLVGSQHGTEPSGSEALQKLALTCAKSGCGAWLDVMNLVLIPDGNPDGRDLHTRLNAANENLNIDYLRLASPETRLYLDMLNRFNPDALMDLHESSARKKILTDEQGWLTDVEAQYEAGNNPNIDPDIRHLTDTRLLPELLARTQEQGLPAMHYQGEILYLNQPVAHGGLRASNFRNYSALQGRVSFLVENRLDPPGGQYSTPGNIAKRRDKQYISATSFLDVIGKHHREVAEAVRNAREAWKTPAFAGRTIQLQYGFGLDYRTPWRPVLLREVATGKQVRKHFPDYGFVMLPLPSRVPEAYAITASQEALGALLKSHGIRFAVLSAPKRVTAIVPRVKRLKVHYPQNPVFRSTVDADIEAKPRNLTLKSGDLLVNTRQPNGWLVPLLLDARSTDSIFQEVAWRSLLIAGRSVPVFAANNSDE